MVDISAIRFGMGDSGRRRTANGDHGDAAIVQVAQGVGGHSGWHAHPGPAIVIVKSGELTIDQAEDCSSRAYTAGTVAVEPAGHVHRARNTGTTTLELWITFLDVPVGAEARIDAPDPGC